MPAVVVLKITMQETAFETLPVCLSNLNNFQISLALFIFYLHFVFFEFYFCHNFRKRATSLLVSVTIPCYPL